MTLAIAGCASVSTPRPEVISEQGFGLEGRISVVHGSQALSGRIAWIHEPAKDEIDLASPLGTQMARLVRSAAGITLTDSDQRVYRAADAESLTERQLGWRLPLAGLTDWVRGRARADVHGDALRDTRGRVATLTQSDWRIEYAYDDAGESAGILPRRLFMRYLKAAEPLEIRLVVDQWSIR